jgi:hypothetical protein
MTHDTAVVARTTGDHAMTAAAARPHTSTRSTHGLGNDDGAMAL